MSLSSEINPAVAVTQAEKKMPPVKIDNPLAFCEHLLSIVSLVACSRTCKRWHQVVLPRLNLTRLQKFTEALQSLFKEQKGKVELYRSSNFPDIEQVNSPNFLEFVLDKIASAAKNYENPAVSYTRTWVLMTSVQFSDDERVHQLVQKYRFHSLRECASLKNELKCLQVPSFADSKDYKKMAISRHHVLLKLVNLYLAEGHKEQAQNIVRECALLKHVYKIGPDGSKEEISGDNESDTAEGKNTMVITCSSGFIVSLGSEEHDIDRKDTDEDDEALVSDNDDIDGESKDIPEENLDSAKDEELLGLASLNLEEGSTEQVHCIVRQMIFDENTIEQAFAIILNDFVSHDHLDEGFEYFMKFPNRPSKRWSSVEYELFEHLVKANRIEKALAMVKMDLPYDTDYIGLEENYLFQITCLFKYVVDPQLIDKIVQQYIKFEGHVFYRFKFQCLFARLLVEKKRGIWLIRL